MLTYITRSLIETDGFRLHPHGQMIRASYRGTMNASTDSNHQSGKSRFAAMYEATAASMKAQFEQARASLDHSGARGGAAEEIVREFLNKALPAALGVTVGQVVDADGNFSGQSDVIIYDARTTPMLFTSAQGGTQTVPIEGFVAVIEVKSVLQKKDLDQLLTHARKLKSMKRRAYLQQALTTHRTMYDKSWAQPPVLYSVFAFTSRGLYVGELNDLQAEIPLHLRVDNLCALDRGLAVNVCLTGHVNGPDSLFSFQGTASKISKLGEVLTDNPLLPWFAMNSSLYVQGDRSPIDLAVYVQDQLRLHATMPPDTDMEIRNELNLQLAEATGVPLDVIRRLAGVEDGTKPANPPGVQLSSAELLALVDPYINRFFVPGPDAGDLFRSLAEVPAEERERVLAQFRTESSNRERAGETEADLDGS